MIGQWLTYFILAVIPWAGPGPASGSGPHRYTFLVFAQPSNFVAPATPKANSGVNLFECVHQLGFTSAHLTATAPTTH